jgi:hypothetical protein
VFPAVLAGLDWRERGERPSEQPRARIEDDDDQARVGRETFSAPPPPRSRVRGAAPPIERPHPPGVV